MAKDSSNREDAPENDDGENSDAEGTDGSGSEKEDEFAESPMKAADRKKTFKALEAARAKQAKAEEALAEACLEVDELCKEIFHKCGKWDGEKWVKGPGTGPFDAGSETFFIGRKSGAYFPKMPKHINAPKIY